MRRGAPLAILAIVAALMPSRSTVAAPAAPASIGEAQVCAALAGQSFGDAHVREAHFVAQGARWTMDQPQLSGAAGSAVSTRAFCRLQGTIEQEIGFELWLPISSEWNGKLLGAGVGGDAGRFNYADLPRGIDRGYAAATTDTGHKAEDRDWMLGDPARLANYTHRANHLLAVAAKAIVARRYGAAPRRSYFIGCSGGGRQGLKELQLYPADYDGIISGANGPETPAMTTRRMWEILQRDGAPGLMSPADWKRVADAGTASCDALDGVTDGVAQDPRRCRFDVAQLQCQAGQGAGTCLSAAQVAFARRFYEPLADGAGQRIDGGLLPGVLVDSGRSQLALGTFGRAIRHRADWNGEGFDLAQDKAAIDRVMPELRADDADVRAFRQRGGKLLMYSGWMDPAVAARMVVAYRDRLVAQAGGDRAADRFLRLYMLPGVYHCTGGPGPDRIGGAGADAPIVDPQHDLLSALEAWVEQGRAPRTIIASKVVDGTVRQTRPICPYPASAVYDGKGDTDDAANFHCALPAERTRR